MKPPNELGPFPFIGIGESGFARALIAPGYRARGSGENVDVEPPRQRGVSFGHDADGGFINAYVANARRGSTFEQSA